MPSSDATSVRRCLVGQARCKMPNLRRIQRRYRKQSSLPLHNECTSNRRRGCLRSIDGNSCGLRANTNPRKNLAMNMCHQILTNPCRKQARAEKTQVRKMVPRLPKKLLNGVVSQHPMKAQQR